MAAILAAYVEEYARLMERNSNWPAEGGCVALVISLLMGIGLPKQAGNERPSP